MARQAKKARRRAAPAYPSRPRVRGTGISVKIATSIVLTTAVLVALGGFILYGQAVAALDEEIDSFGVTLARTIALQDIDTWRYTSGTYAELREGIKNALVRFPAWLLASGGVVGAEAGLQPDRDKLRRELDVIREHDRTRTDTNRRRLEGVTVIFAGRAQIDADVVDVFVFDQRGKLLTKANRAPARFDPHGRARAYVATGSDGTTVETRTEIETGTGMLGDRRFPARSFTEPVFDEAGRKTGTVQVLVSEDRVAARKRKLALSGLAVMLAVLAAGVAVSLVVARALAAPLRRLVDVVNAVARGNYDLKARGHMRDEIGLLALSIDTMRQSLQEAEKDQTTLAAREREMQLVADLRRNLLPNRVPEVTGFELEASYRPTTRVGGNYYDFLELPDGRLGVLLADTAGEGVIAGFTMNLFRGFVHAEQGWKQDPVAMLCRVNRHLARDIKKGVFVTAFLVVLTPSSRELELVNAGHLPLLKWVAKERKLRVASAEGIALGLDDGPVFEERLRATRLTLDRGDRVVLYTEGVYKIAATDGAELGEVGFNKLVAKNAPMHSAAFMNLVERQMEKFREGGPETGDYTIITLKAV
ncbi:MAG: SpoIIE family protein phosphatase [Planctomycetes bacterium]|nr:SpoIIE family protein phosphatase [Planctomycetota bacterium]